MQCSSVLLTLVLQCETDPICMGLLQGNHMTKSPTCQMPKAFKAEAMLERESGVKAAYCVICLKLYTSSAGAALHNDCIESCNLLSIALNIQFVSAC